VAEGRLKLDDKDFNYTDADGDPDNGWDNPQIAYVPILISLDSGSMNGMTAEAVSYNGEMGSKIVIAGKLYINIPVAASNAETPNEATVSNWSLLDPDDTVVIIRASKGTGDAYREYNFIFKAMTAVDD